MVEFTQVKHSFQTILQELTDAVGPSGYESPVSQVMEKWVAPFVQEIDRDRLGSLIARRGTEGPRIMIASHLDEIGMLVTQIDDSGYIRFQPLGGWWSQVLPAQRVEIVTRTGRLLGIVGSTPPHLMDQEERKKGIPLEELFIDVGVESREEAEELGIHQGAFVVPYSPFTHLPGSNRLVGKAFDNRLGCAVVVEVLKRLAQGIPHPNQIFGVATVLEEMGRRGALTASYKVKPDIALVVDVGMATDTPGLKNRRSPNQLGKGPTLVLYDAGHISHQGLLELAREVAEELNIPYQNEVIQRGATDASHIHTSHQGVPTISMGVPARYIHSHASMIDQRDVDQLIIWIIEIIQRLDQQRVESLYHL